jgi:hypothetical protein
MTKEIARAKLERIDRGGCGGRCRGRDTIWHRVIDIRGDIVNWPPAKHGYQRRHRKRRNGKEITNTGGSMENPLAFVVSSEEFLQKYRGGAA